MEVRLPSGTARSVVHSRFAQNALKRNPASDVLGMDVSHLLGDLDIEQVAVAGGYIIIAIPVRHFQATVGDNDGCFGGF
jgi:hypothetical protein